MGVVQVYPAPDESVRELCRQRYLGHPKGCPNYGKRPTCPPNAPLLWDAYDGIFSVGVICVYNRYDIGAHVEKMRAKHPHWSERQLYCCLYWQGTARKQLRQQVNEYLTSTQGQGLVAVYVPEACGIDVTATMYQAGIELEWPPRKVAYQIAFLCYPSVEEAINDPAIT